MDIDKVMSLLTLILKNTVRFYEKSNCAEDENYLIFDVLDK